MNNQKTKAQKAIDVLRAELATGQANAADVDLLIAAGVFSAAIGDDLRQEKTTNSKVMLRHVFDKLPTTERVEFIRGGGTLSDDR